MLVHLAGGLPATRRLVTGNTLVKETLPAQSSYLDLRASGNTVRVFFNEDDANANVNYIELLTTDAPRLIPARVTKFWHISPGGAGVLEATTYQT